MMARRYPVGIQTFSEIIRGGYVYVDKTDLVWQLAHYAKYVFLSRPRRFGKSLLTSTLESYFQGEKELFDGLKIMPLEQDWTEHPVIRLDLSLAKAQFTAEDLKNRLLLMLDDYAEVYGRKDTEVTPGGLIDGLIKRAYQQTGRQVVIIIDECHRDTFGDMLINIKHTFPESVLFGFTGTPIDKENQKKLNTTATVFGNELHRYTLADAITDKNVLGFDPRMVLTYKDKDLRKKVALEKSKSKTEEEAISNKTKAKVYYHYMNDVPMAGYTDESGKYHSGIEDHIPSSQYNLDKHRIAVVNDIKDGWLTLSRNNKFHAILATSSIVEAIAYYRLFRELMPSLKVTALFDPSDNHNETSIEKIDGLKDIILDYNSFYSQKFSISNYGMMRKDISARMSHTEPYLGLHKTPEMQINLLIVVDQMLTGFDSKWVNTLYLDKMLEQEHLIQAFSRTNRLFGPDKPFGNIRFYRRPHTMKRNIDDAISHYSGDRPQGLFVEQLEYNLHKLNEIFADIDHLFSTSGIKNFERLPDDISERQQFVKLFNQFNRFLEAARIQGYIAFEKMQKVEKEDGTTVMVEMLFDENQYNALLQRYNELSHGGGGGGDEDVPYDIETYITEIDTGKIDADYMNAQILFHSDTGRAELRIYLLA